VGENDEPCFAISLTLAEQLKGHGIRCELEVYPDLAHEYPPDFEVVLARALEYILRD
jgi:dipeptidyl aminopeptidase/acylaminoacyl peptidase